MKIFIKNFISICIFFLIAFILIHFNFSSGKVNSSGNSVDFNKFPDKRTCGTMDRLELTLKENPAYKKVLDDLEIYTKDYIKKHKYDDITTIVTIPVVVHVVYHQNSENISFEQIKSQIDVMTNDFRRFNADSIYTPSCFKPVSADPMVMFTLAKRDPDGNPTLGIRRVYTNVTQFGLDNTVKFTSTGGDDAWDRDRYLNLWVCNLGGNLLGYAEFPGGSAATDGVVILTTAFGSVGNVIGPYNKGRTATHEIGHWLWLYHIWGDDGGACYGSDYVDDTPNQGAENYGCPGFPHISCDNGPNGDMYMNYMDYTDDGCMNIYTQGQTVRIWSALNGPRSPILTSNGGIPVSGHPIVEFYTDSLTINKGSSVHFYDFSAGIPTSWNWTITGSVALNSTNQNPVITFNTPGYYNVKLKASNSYGSDSLTKISYIKVLGPVMNSFDLIAPPSFTRIQVSSANQELANFNWFKTSYDPAITYKWSIKKAATQNEQFYLSNNSGQDSIISVRKSFLDTLANNFGTTGDSVWCIWKAWAYNGVDSSSSNTSFLVTLVRVPIGIKQISSEIPESFKLYNNYPNPFNPVTIIKFQLPKQENVTIKIFDILGREASTLVNNEKKDAGYYEVKFDASNLASGLYFYKIEAGSFIETRKMMLIK